ncbi:uncharacterized protein K02A2.6-like isoform X1 [Aedes albopictus]|uniref:RNA-directed DNA polymerase n=1 Tax=Aedes albopictus TaxID=7160 RepID=A0ABM1YK51_AEDAL
MSVSTTIEPYLPNSIPFAQYVEQLEYVFLNNNVPEERYKTSFLAVCGVTVFSEIKKLFPGQDVKTFDKCDSEVINSYKFWSRRQGRNEKSEDFVIAVKVLAEQCGFGTFKDRAIRDLLVIGVYNREIQKRLCDEDDLTAARAEKLIMNHEISNIRTSVLKDDEDHNTSIVARLGRKEVRSSSKHRYRGRNKSGNRSVSFSPRHKQGRYGDRRYDSEKPTYFCSFCKKSGHTRKFCYKLHGRGQHQADVKFIGSPKKTSSSSKSGGSNFKRPCYTDDEDEEDLPCMTISSINRINEACHVKVLVEKHTLTMEIDCGSAETVISEELFLRNFGQRQLLPCNKKLAVIDGKRLKVLGKISVSVQLKGKLQQLHMIVLRCDNDFTPLMGRTWLDCFYAGWRNVFSNPGTKDESINKLDEENVVDQLKSKFSTVFDGDFSSPIVGYEGDLVLKEDKPIFRKAYGVPLRLRDKVIEHLDSLERDGVITPVETSEWASPVVIVMKKDQTIRLVIDCKVSINKVIIPNTYPLPVAQDLFASLSGSKVFCSLDLAGAYTQLLLSQASRKFMVINTIKGLYVYNRLPQGASSSASIFQRVMDQVLGGLDNVFCYLDDVLIAGTDWEDCRRKLYLVLERLAKANIKVNLKKCKFFVTELPYLGHILTNKGLSPCPLKIETIREAKAPRNVSELKAFLGLLNYYSKFIPNLSSRIQCLYGLLKKNVRFLWTDECEQTFKDCKSFLLRPCLLEYFDPTKPIVVTTDASSYGLGGVMSHVIDGEERPVCFTSFSLNDAQRKYPILHLEALAVVCAVKKFHKFLFGMRFVIYTDHKPLIGIFGKEGKNQISVTRLQRYVIELSIYDYEIIYRPSSKMANADFCSRFPLAQPVPKAFDREFVKSLNFTETFPIDYKEIAKETLRDEFLVKIMEYLRQGWPNRLDRRFRDVYSHHQELEEVEGCVLFHDRVIIPDTLKSNALKLLHRNHSGINKMKQLARRTVYWFGMNKDVEEYVGRCRICNQMTPVTRPASYSPWIPTNKPFSRVHADFFHLDHKTFLVIVDSYTKWIELEYMKCSTDSKNVIKVFLNVFARYGLPDVLVTDGGPPFNSTDFVDFFERQGVNVMKSPPYHPESNGQAERMVRLVKDVFKKFLIDPDMKKLETDLQISYFLLNYRNTCQEDGSCFPSERLLSYRPKTLLDLINPKTSFKHNLNKRHDDSSPTRSISTDHFNDQFVDLKCGDLIYYKNANKSDIRRWLPATYLKRISSTVFQISLGGRLITAHKRQIKISDDHSRKTSSHFVIRGESALVNPRKRRREPDVGEEASSDQEPDFYGFPAESFIFREDSPIGDQIDRREINQEMKQIRKSNRNAKKKRKGDFLYY